MNNIIKKTKIILFIVLLVAMILPFSNFETIHAEKESKEKKDASKKKEKKDKKDKDKSKKYNYEKKSNFEKKDLHNYEADLVLEDMSSLLNEIHDINKNAWGKVGEKSEIRPQTLEKMKNLQDDLEKVTKEHKEKIIDKDLREKIKKARQRIIETGIPTNMIGVGIDHLYIQLSKENAHYEQLIIKLVKNVPYLLEYGEGFKRSYCLSTESNCEYEIGGMQIQIKKNKVPVTCSLSIPIKKDGVDGFLTAAHCFHGDKSKKVYQPDTSLKSNIIGYSDADWRSFEHNGECDCAWIKDTTNIQQKTSVFAEEDGAWPILDTHVPSLGETALFRGVHSNNGQNHWSDQIVFDDAIIEAKDFGLFGDKETKNLMAFKSSAKAGDSGGSVFSGYSYIGIVVGGGKIEGVEHVLFVPWHHVTENISGLEFIPNP